MVLRVLVAAPLQQIRRVLRRLIRPLPCKQNEKQGLLLTKHCPLMKMSPSSTNQWPWSKCKPCGMYWRLPSFSVGNKPHTEVIGINRQPNLGLSEGWKADRITNPDGDLPL